MSVGFGFSVGDFLQAIKLVATVIDSLSASSRSSAELRELLHQLYSLETALQEVKRLEVDESLHAEVLALKQSAAQCQRTISGFLDRTQVYQPQVLCANGIDHTIQAKWRRLKWALCKKREVVQFKTDLLAHTESIQMLLSTLQMKSMQLNQKGQERAQVSLVSQIQAGFGDCMARLCPISDTLSTISAHAKECLENTRQIISVNVRVFQVILDIQNHLKSIPGQVERQQPVYLNDALGRYTPFHLEFIRSSEALVSVLSINFKPMGSAAEKIRNGDFTIHDTFTKHDIDLDRSWEECFMPGQHVEMSVIFDTPKERTNTCPKCQSVCVIEPRKDTKCETCGLVFRSFSDIEKGPNPATHVENSNQQLEKVLREFSPSKIDKNSRQPKRKANDEDDLTEFRRVRLRTPGVLCKVYKLVYNEWLDICTGHARTGSKCSQPSVTVLSEDPEIVNFATIVHADYDFQMASDTDTLFVWKDFKGRDFGMSFRDANGCKEIWDYIEIAIQLERSSS